MKTEITQSEKHLITTADKENYEVNEELQRTLDQILREFKDVFEGYITIKIKHIRKL